MPHLGISVSSPGAKETAVDLDKVAAASARAETSSVSMSKSMQEVSGRARETGMLMRNLSFQINDIVTGLAMGQSPFMIMAQQGGQVYQVLQMGQGGVGGSLRSIKEEILGIITPGRLLVAGFLAAGAAGYGLYRLLRTEAPNAVDTLKEHSRLLEVVKEAYRGAKGTAAQFYDQSRLITELQVRQNLIAVQAQIDQQARALVSSVTRPTSVPSEIGIDISGAINEAAVANSRFRELNHAIDAFNNSVRSASDINTFRDAVAAIGLAAQATNPELAREAAEILKNTKELGDLAAAAERAERMLRLMTGSETDADRKAFGLSTQAKWIVVPATVALYVAIAIYAAKAGKGVKSDAG